jgi:F0F1-type ATP synthase delta subunit
MKTIKGYQTEDGKVHITLENAKTYADNRYGNALLTLAKHLVTIDKYKEMTEFLDNNLQRFLKLQELKDDIHNEPETDET